MKTWLGHAQFPQGSQVMSPSCRKPSKSAPPLLGPQHPASPTLPTSTPTSPPAALLVLLHRPHWLLSAPGTQQVWSHLGAFASVCCFLCLERVVYSSYHDFFSSLPSPPVPFPSFLPLSFFLLSFFLSLTNEILFNQSFEDK